MPVLDHEEVVIRKGPRSGLPVIIAIHSTVLGQAVGGCRVWHYGSWQDALADALRLSAGMTSKCAASGLNNGGGKTVVAVPAEARLDGASRRDLLLDVGDMVAALDGRYATGPDVGTGPDDMTVIGERTSHVFCAPPERGGSGDSAPHTAAGVSAALRAVCAHIDGSQEITGRRMTVLGLGNVGERLARTLAAGGAKLMLSDINPSKQALAAELGASWASPGQAIIAEADILIPAALGGVITSQVIPDLRCRAIAGPANNQLAAPEVADQLHRRGIIWVPDYVVGAGGVIHALAVELHHLSETVARARVNAIGTTVTTLLDTSARTGVDPAGAAFELAQSRLTAAVGR
jgi:glutamate dehydrogenase/leucine dehydrogenase